ncbi:MAG TPA: AraC family ligand binding domain-containing protein [Anaerolineales bacterium]|nr:AraC family ligand binding domain-containing protein [Anaerolineales bacterium]
MPVIIHPNEMIIQKGNGWVEIILADENAIGVPAIAAHRWSFEPNTHGPQQTHSGVDQLLYVIAGSGVAVVGEERLPLEKESVLWLEPDDSYHFEAGPEGMEILHGYPPETRVWNP